MQSFYFYSPTSRLLPEVTLQLFHLPVGYLTLSLC